MHDLQAPNLCQNLVVKAKACDDERDNDNESDDNGCETQNGTSEGTIEDADGQEEAEGSADPRRSTRANPQVKGQMHHQTLCEHQEIDKNIECVNKEVTRTK